MSAVKHNIKKESELFAAVNSIVWKGTMICNSRRLSEKIDSAWELEQSSG